ncbi:MAG TPA: ribosome maturation factor RimM [Acidimicrobiales bacterium]|jgi:16S rRNA processing protein RimM|nr:ribosome maturation factor RimM [Acidimicrobiales bacterium]
MLEVGRVGKAHGLRGEVIVSLITDRTERVAPGATLVAGTRSLEVEASRPHQKNFIVAFAGVRTREDAERLHGMTLHAEPLADADELWVHELIGVDVVAVDGSSVGVVESIQANPASDLLVLASGVLVPAVFIVDRRDGAVVVDLPDGLLEL